MAANVEEKRLTLATTRSPINYRIQHFQNSQEAKQEGVVKRDGIRFKLEGISLWRRFHALGTEMIVTKSGRRMFPVLSISINGLEPSANYSLMVDMECVDSKREAELPCRTFVHPDSPASGAHWMKGTISFDKIKLTNNQLDQNGHIIVNSMHRYLPRIHLVRHPDGEEDNENSNNGDSITVTFEETAFIAVTAYQNHRITSLKIESNPFAKGFRECELDDPRILPFLLPFYSLTLPFRNT
ncbi:T-box [Ancylostoma ceylanicum]|uniref:T-box n=1 Tax=Ancylostoma ceylanicum TaxID=53326 RepID=A0A0D6LXD3_9BILA|nr:T-box [Ancylostoma ceylanicum]